MTTTQRSIFISPAGINSQNSDMTTNLDSYVDGVMFSRSHGDVRNYSIKAAALTGVCLLDLASGEATEALAGIRKDKKLYLQRVKHTTNLLSEQSSMASCWIMYSAKKGENLMLSVLDKSDEEIAQLRSILYYTTKQGLDNKNIPHSDIFAHLCVCAIFLQCSRSAFLAVKDGLAKKTGHHLSIRAYNVCEFLGALRMLTAALEQSLKLSLNIKASPEMEQAMQNIINKIQTTEWLRKITSKDE